MRDAFPLVCASAVSSPTDMSRLRLGAACGLLKLACCPRYSELITVDQFLSLACVIQVSYIVACKLLVTFDLWPLFFCL